MIEQQITEFVAAADWTDDCRVRVELKRRTTTMLVSQAREFAAEIFQAADEAERASRAAERLPEPASFDVAILSPDCGAGEKHRACIGTAWDIDKDELTNCTCSCHTEEAAA